MQADSSEAKIKEIGSSDLNISEDEYEGEIYEEGDHFGEDKSSELLDIVSAGIEDLPSESDWEEEKEEKGNTFETEEKKKEEISSEAPKISPDVNGYKVLIYQYNKKYFRFLKNMHGLFGGISKYQNIYLKLQM